VPIVIALFDNAVFGIFVNKDPWPENVVADNTPVFGLIEIAGLVTLTLDRLPDVLVVHSG
jgi:hypothetical protein